MLINELPDDLRALAEEQGRRHSRRPYEKRLDCAFFWFKSSQGQEFWELVDDGRFDEARALLAQQKESK